MQMQKTGCFECATLLIYWFSKELLEDIIRGREETKKSQEMDAELAVVMGLVTEENHGKN